MHAAKAHAGIEREIRDVALPQAGGERVAAPCGRRGRLGGGPFGRCGIVLGVQCSLTCGSVRRVMMRAAVSSAIFQKPCSASSCIL